MTDKTVLLLENDHYLTQLYRCQLDSFHYHVVQSSQLSGMLEMVKLYSPSSVILDMDIAPPEKLDDTIALLRRCQVPVISISSHEAYLQRAVAIAAATLPKPIPADKLANTLEGVLISQPAQQIG